MKNPNTMTPSVKNAYIFDKNPGGMFPGGRLAWITDCLLGDIQTFLDGIENYIKTKVKPPGRGGGNVSVPSLISTALELVSSMYAGKTKYKDKKSYKADKNVQQFVTRFFPEHYRNFPLLLWDGIRNGIVHTFSPKPFEYQRKNIRFQFFVEDGAYATEVNGIVQIKINAFKLYEVIKEAIEDYCKELKTDDTLKDNFIRAWSSIEEDSSRNIDKDIEKSKEAKTLLSKLENANNYLPLREV